MMKTLAALVMTLTVLGTTATEARADHDRHGRRDRWGFDFGFGDGGSFWGFDYGRGGSSGSGECCDPVPVQPSCGHWECRTETYVITPGGWRQVWVGDCSCGHYEWTWVAPVYGTRTVRVWVNY